MTVVGSFDMPGVPARLAEETFRDITSAPSFVPHILEVQMLRGEPSTVGNCWREKRIFGGRKLTVVKNITHMSTDPYFSCQASMEYEETAWFLPKLSQTFTFDIVPTTAADMKDDSQGEEKKEPSCKTRWKMGFVAHGGMWSRFLACIGKPCLNHGALRYTEEEMEYYYQEAVRRTRKHLNPEETNTSVSE